MTRLIELEFGDEFLRKATSISIGGNYEKNNIHNFGGYHIYSYKWM